MMDTLETAIADYIGNARAATSAWSGGRGRLGPMKQLLLDHRASILQARSAPSRLTWAEIAEIAAKSGIRRANGLAYDAAAVRRAWNTLPQSCRPEQESASTQAIQALQLVVPSVPRSDRLDVPAPRTTSDIVRTKGYGDRR